MTMIPNPGQCLQLLKEAGCSDEVINHCKAVRKVAVRIAKKAHANIQLVEAGALLHDIGRSKTQGIMHGIEGAKIANTVRFTGKYHKYHRTASRCWHPER